jgi:hypothetical protein
VLLIGGAARSSLDTSWQWVPLWLPAGLACIGVALLLHQSDTRQQNANQPPRPKPRRPRSFRTPHKPPA